MYMRTYELLYIIPAILTDEEVAQTESDILALIQKYGGNPKESRRLGKFKFAYLIKKIRHGYYVMVYFDSEPENVAKINEALRIHERVIRHLILNKEEAGGEEFNLVQFQEVVVDGSPKDKENKSKRKKFDKKSDLTSQDVQVAAELDKNDEVEENTDEADDIVGIKEKSETIEDVLSGLSSEELDKKIDEALFEEAK